MDKPKAAYDKGLERFIFNIDDELRREQRRRMLAVTKDDLIRCANQYLLTPATQGQTSRVVFGTEEIQKEKLMEVGWRVTKPVEIS